MQFFEKLKIFRLLIPLVFLLSPLTASAGLLAKKNNCNILPKLFNESTSALRLESPSDRFLIWEETANEARYVQSTAPLKLGAAKINISNLIFLRAGKTSPTVENTFFSGNSFLFPRHPFNTSNKIPFANIEPSANLDSRLTSSRSVAILKDGKPEFSVKIPTDHVTPQKLTTGKLDMGSDIQCGIKRSQYLMEIDQIRTPPKNSFFLKEILGVIDPVTNNGILVRDLNPLLDGNYYLPAFSIPHVGRKIAALNGADFGKFWGEHYLRAIGRAKAELLLRYGIELENPHTQNMLIQLNAAFKPTGIIVFRDISDTKLVEPVVNAMNRRDALIEDLNLGFPIDQSVQPFTNGYSTANFELPQSLLQTWQKQENDAFYDHVKKLLGLNNKTLKTAKFNVPTTLAKYLASSQGQKMIKSYQKSLMK